MSCHGGVISKDNHPSKRGEWVAPFQRHCGAQVALHNSLYTEQRHTHTTQPIWSRSNTVSSIKHQEHSNARKTTGGKVTSISKLKGDMKPWSWSFTIPAQAQPVASPPTQCHRLNAETIHRSLPPEAAGHSGERPTACFTTHHHVPKDFTQTTVCEPAFLSFSLQFPFSLTYTHTDQKVSKNFDLGARGNEESIRDWDAALGAGECDKMRKCIGMSLPLRVLSSCHLTAQPQRRKGIIQNKVKTSDHAHNNSRSNDTRWSSIRRNLSSHS